MAKRTGAAHVVTIKKTVIKVRNTAPTCSGARFATANTCATRPWRNITHFGPEKVEQLRRTMRGEKLVNIDDAITLTDSRPHGHVNAVLSIARALTSSD
jgi:hypothetical protein